MADELSAPLGRKKAKARPALGLSFSAEKLPLARAAFGLVALILAGVALRIFFVNDPMGGQPVADIGVNSTRNANSIAQTVAPTGPTGTATITAGPEYTPSGASISMVGSDVPDGSPTAPPPPTAAQAANAQGLFPDMLEDSEHGPIPRISPAGKTPFAAYAPASVTLATAGHKPLIAIVVTGLGLNSTSTASAIDSLPNGVTLAFAPYGKNLQANVTSARTAGHEILLEVPLEPFDYPDSDPGPDTLLTGQAPRNNLDKLFSVLGKFGGYVGLTNFMGARFTSSAQDFNPIMEELGTRGLGYLDDGSSNRTVAPQLAQANAVPFGRADATLDAVPAAGPINDQLKALEDKATSNGSAIGMISALPVSVQALGQWARAVESRGFTLVPVSALMQKPGA